MENRARPLPSLSLSLGNRKYTWAGGGGYLLYMFRKISGDSFHTALAELWRWRTLFGNCCRLARSASAGGTAARGDFLIQ